MQAELLRVTAELHAAGKQIVVASQCAPTELSGVDAAFLELVADGLVVSLGHPEYETRYTILRNRSDERGSQFDEGVLEAVASYEIQDVRELIGVLNRLVALQAVSEMPLTATAARALYEGEVGTTEAAARETPEVDEFEDFLSGVSNTVKRHVDVWESRLNDVAKRWADKGFCTDRLASVTSSSMSKSVDEFLAEFEREVQELESLRESVVEIDTSLADDPVFFDPDRIAEAREIASRVASKRPTLPGPSKGWRFQNFIGSWANAVAVEAAKAVAQYPGYERNPLVFVGSTGVGKTHLLNATGNAISEAVGGVVVCLSTPELYERLRQAESSGRLEELRSEFSNAAALLLDDVHLAAGEEWLQQEVRLLITRAQSAGRQVVCTSSAHPENVPGLDELLASLLSSGFVGALASPDRELRRGIVAGILKDRLGSVEIELADYLADRPADSVREVTGVVGRVLEAAEFRGVRPTAALARELVEGANVEPGRPTPGVRTSGVMVTPSTSVRSVEKMIWVWPNPSERLIEELS
jgi:chromosomal replication initiation ATPase DnaA